MTVADYLLPGWLTALRARRLGTTITPTAGNSAEVAEAVLSGAADLAGQLLAVSAEGGQLTGRAADLAAIPVSPAQGAAVGPVTVSLHAGCPALGGG
jgi:hypothetical protein